MSDARDTLLRVAVLEDADVRASVDAATLEHFFPAPAPHEEDHNPLVGDVSVSRPATAADYVAAIHEHIEKFDGLDIGDVTEAAVAAVLPQEEEQ